MLRRSVALGLCLLVCASWVAGANIEIMFMNSGSSAPAGLGGTPVGISLGSSVMLSEVPTSTWTYGCSATAAGMLFGYYDRNGYEDMYTGPTNGGVAPLHGLGQGTGTPIAGSTSLIATMNGFDGRVSDGHVDDYWVGTGTTGADPWEVGGIEHVWGDCTADFMGTSQWKWDFSENGNLDFNADGSTALFSYNSEERLYDYVPPESSGLPQTALCHGMRLFAESRGYAVEENYSQKIDARYAGGFSFVDYMAEIDAGRPVMIQVTGHSMVGVGYDASEQSVLLHDTWDNDVHSMDWGGAYASREFQAVTVMHLAAVPEPMTVVLFLLGGVGLMRRQGRE